MKDIRDCEITEEMQDEFPFIIGAMVSGKFVLLEMCKDKLEAETRRIVLERDYQGVTVLQRKKK